MKTITINFDEENKRVEILMSAPTAYQEFVMLMLNSAVTFAQKVLEQAPEEYKHAVKGELYDVLNIGTSNALQMFAPEFEVQHTEAEEEELKEMEGFIDSVPLTLDATDELVEKAEEDQITTIG